ncbi:MAG: hypothetical protein JJU36_03330 [Phycisphaeraceae bacterium]|nr:hypothetical protein [Phycisphaeraceae bacterium]
MTNRIKSRMSGVRVACLSGALLLGPGAALADSVSDPATFIQQIEAVAAEGTEAQAQRDAIGAQTADAYLAARTEEGFDPSAWLAAIRVAGRYAPAPTRLTVADDLLTRLAPDAQTAATMNFAALDSLGRALVAMQHRPRAGQAIARWIDGSEAYSELNPADLRVLSWFARMSGQAGLEARRKLIERLLENDASAIRAIGLETNTKFIEFLGGSPTDDQRAQWRQRLHEAYIQSPQTVNQMPLPEAHSLARMLAGFRAIDSESEVFVIWVAGAAQVPHDVSTGQMRWLVREIGRVARSDPSQETLDGVERARRNIGEHLQARYMGDLEALRATGPGGLRGPITAAAATLDPDTRADWRDRLLLAFAPDEQALGALNAQATNRLRSSIAPLDRVASNDLAWRWMQTQGDDYDSQHGNDLLTIARYAVRAPAAREIDREALMVAVKTLVDARTGGQPVDYRTALQLMMIYHTARNPQRARYWLNHAYDIALGTPEKRQAATRGTFNELLFHCYHFAEVGIHRPRPELVEVLVRLTLDGAYPNPELELASYLLFDDDSRDQIEGILVDDQGQPRLELARLLAHAHHLNTTSSDYRVRVSELAAPSRAQQPSQPLWDVAEAYARVYARQNPRIGLAIVDVRRALGTAEIESQRYRLLVELVSLYREVRNYRSALALIDSVQAQFDEERRQSLQTLRQAIESAAARQAREQAALHNQP